MKRVLLVATAIAGLAFAAPSLAQSVTGTVGVNGSVADRCTVNGSDSGSSFTGTISLGELTKTNGTLRNDLQGNTAVSGATVKVTITCTGSNPTVSLSATELSAGLGTPPAGFSGTIDYTSELDLDKAAGGTGVFTYATPTASPTTGSLGGSLANSSNNVRVSAYSFTTVGGNTDTLQAGTYNGQINVSIGPSV